MDVILEQKKEGEAQFRVHIDEFLAESLFTKEEDQLSPEVLQEILSSSTKEGLFSNGKVMTDKLMEAIYDSGNHFSTKEFSKIFGNKKELKIGDIFGVLNSHDLTSFDLEEEIIKETFEDEKLSLKRLDRVMKEVGLNELNRKDKEILIECFDYNGDGNVTAEDLQEMMDRAVSSRSELKNSQKVARVNSKAVGDQLQSAEH